MNSKKPSNATLDANNQMSTDHWLYGHSGEQTLEMDWAKQAETQLLHALLSQSAVDEEARRAANAERVRRVMSAIEQRPAPIKRLAPYLSTAASVVGVALLLFVMIPQSSPALAEVEKILSAMASFTDRHYRIEVNNLSGEPIPTKDAQGRRLFHGGDIYLRAPNHYLLRQDITGNKYKLLGNNGGESWTLNHRGKLKRFDASVIKLPFTAHSSDVVITDITENLERFKEGYDLTLRHDQTVKGFTQPLSSIEAVKTDATMKGVKHVTLYYHPETHLVQRMLFHRTHMQGQRDIKHVIIDLVSTEPLPDNWFDYQYHLQD